MPKSDIIIRTWNQDKNSRDVKYQNALEIVKQETTAPESQIPEWVKDNAKWWSEGQISESEFINGIQYMIQNEIIKVPDTKIGESKSTQIPGWIKNNAKWWADNLISEKEFVSGLQYLMTTGIIVV